MNRNRRSPTPFERIVPLELQLHDLIAAGQCDTDEADAVRDAMDAPWYSRSPAEQDCVGGLARDLEWLDDPGSVASVYPGNVESPESDLMAFRNAVLREDWKAALELMRANESRLSRATAAFLRGTLWAHLRFPAVAVRFLSEAAQLDPNNSVVHAGLLTCLLQAGDVRQAVEEANRISSNTSDPLSLLKAAEAYFVAADHDPSDVGVELRARGMATAERGLRFSAQRAGDATLTVAMTSIYVHMAITHWMEDDLEAARRACDHALALRPDDANALMLLGSITNQPKEFLHGFSQREAMDLPAIFGLSTDDESLAAFAYSS